MGIVDVLATFFLDTPVFNLTTLSTNKNIIDSRLVKFGRSICCLKVSNDFLSSCLQINNGNFNKAFIEIGEAEDKCLRDDDSSSTVFNLDHLILFRSCDIASVFLWDHYFYSLFWLKNCNSIIIIFLNFFISFFSLFLSISIFILTFFITFTFLILNRIIPFHGRQVFLFDGLSSCCFQVC